MNTGTMASPALASSNGRSRLGASLCVKGEISGSEDLHVDGSVDGLIQMEGRTLTVGQGAKIVADIMAAQIIVRGSIKGNLCARDRLEITKDGSIVGELTTERVIIEDGAYFKGSIEIERKTVAAVSDTPAPADETLTSIAESGTPVNDVAPLSRTGAMAKPGPSFLSNAVTARLPSSKK